MLSQAAKWAVRAQKYKNFSSAEKNSKQGKNNRYSNFIRKRKKLLKTKADWVYYLVL